MPNVVDAHLQVWNPDSVHYPWMTAENAGVHRTYRVPDIEDQLADEDVAWVVLVQAADNRADSELMLFQALSSPRVAGRRGVGPPRRPRRRRHAAGQVAPRADRRDRPPRATTVRDPDWLLDAAVDDSLTLLTERRLTLDLTAHTPDGPGARRDPRREPPQAHGRPRPPRRSPARRAAGRRPGRLDALVRPARRRRADAERRRQAVRADHRGRRGLDPGPPAARRRPCAGGVRPRPAHARQRLAVRAPARATPTPRSGTGCARRWTSWATTTAPQCSAVRPPRCTGSRSTRSDRATARFAPCHVPMTSSTGSSR